MQVSTTLFHFSLMLTTSLFSDCAALRCYMCGTGGDAVSCDLFDLASSWTLFEVDCPPEPDQVCIKTNTDLHHSNQTTATRGCTPLATAFDVPNRVTCAQTTRESLTCLCDSHLCNDAVYQLGSSGATFSSLTFVVSVYHLMAQ